MSDRAKDRQETARASMGVMGGGGRGPWLALEEQVVRTVDWWLVIVFPYTALVARVPQLAGTKSLPQLRTWLFPVTGKYLPNSRGKAALALLQMPQQFPQGEKGSHPCRFSESNLETMMSVGPTLQTGSVVRECVHFVQGPWCLREFNVSESLTD